MKRQDNEAGSCSRQDRPQIKNHTAKHSASTNRIQSNIYKAICDYAIIVLACLLVMSPLFIGLTGGR